MRYLISIFLISIFFSCSQQYCYENELVLKDGWAFNEAFVNNVDIDKSRCPNVSAHLELTHTDMYPFENIYLRVSVVEEGKDAVEEVISFSLQDDLGAWIGDKKGETYKALLNLPIAIPGTVSDSYILKVEQYTREDTLKGVEAVRLVIF